MSEARHFRLCGRGGARLLRRGARAAALAACLTVELAAQQAPQRVFVEGRPLAAAAALPELRESRLYLPLFSIAQELRDTVEIDPGAQAIRVRLSHSGEMRSFHRTTGEVRRDAIVLAMLPDSAQIVLALRPEGQLLPVDVLSFLLDVSIQVSHEDGSVSIRRQTQFAQAVQTSGRLPIQLNRIEYSETLGVQEGIYGHNLRLGSRAQLYEGTLSASVDFTGASGQKALNFLSGTVTLERLSGQMWTAGDFALARTSRLASAPARGFSIEQSFGGNRLTVFGGAALSSTIAGVGAFSLRTFGTGVAGLLWSTRKFLEGGNGFGYESGAVHFAGGDRRGTLFLQQISHRTRRNLLQVSAGFGAFRVGPGSAGQTGGGLGLDVSDSLTWKRHSLVFRGSHFGEKFVTPQINDALRGRTTFGSSWAAPLATGLNAALSVTHSRVRTGLPQNTTTYTWSLGYAPAGRRLPSISASQTIARSDRGTPFANLQVTLTKSFPRWRPVLTYNRLDLADRKVESASLGASIDLKNRGTLMAFETVSTGGINSGTVDWNPPSLWGGRLQLGGGLGYARNPTEFTGISDLNFLSRFSAWVRLPRANTVQFSYQHNGFRKEFRLNLGGAIFSRARESVLRPIGVAPGALPGTISGRLYQDLNLNGRFDSGVDQPLDGVSLWLDNSLLAKSDAQGIYRYPAVFGGPHRVRLDLTTVAANFSPLNELDRALDLPARVHLTMDFSFTQTGAALGTAWFDTNANGVQDAGENPASDIRILCSCGQETLTTVDGYFIFGDVLPGEIYLTPDLQGLPQLYVVKPQRLRAVVVAGKRVTGLKLALQPAERRIEERVVPPQVLPQPSAPRQSEDYSPIVNLTW